MALDELGGEGEEPLDVALRAAELEDEILALHVTKVPQSLLEGLN